MHSPKDIRERERGPAVQRIGRDESHELFGDVAWFPQVVPHRSPVVNVVERKNGQSLKCLKFAIELGTPQLNSVDAYQLPVRLRDCRIEPCRVQKRLLRKSSAIAPPFDLTGDQMGLGGDRMVVRYVRKIRERLIQSLSNCRELGSQEPIERRRRSQLAEPIQVPRDLSVSSRPEMISCFVPNRIGVMPRVHEPPETPAPDHQQHEKAAGHKHRSWPVAPGASLSRPARRDLFARLAECSRIAGA